MNTLEKLFLDLAAVVPPSCVSPREAKLKAERDRYRKALQDIAYDHRMDDPRSRARAELGG